MSRETKKNSLSSVEWFFILFFLGLFTSLAVIAEFSSRGADRVAVDYYDRTKPISVRVSGAVKREGVYQVPFGSSLKKVFRLAGVKKSGDTDHFDLQMRLFEEQELVVPERKKILIYIEGAVKNPGAREVAVGSRVCDLASLGIFLVSADPKAIRSKKKLSHKQRLFIPKKKGA